MEGIIRLRHLPTVFTGKRSLIAHFNKYSSPVPLGWQTKLQPCCIISRGDIIFFKMFVLSYFEQGMYTFDYKYVIKENLKKKLSKFVPGVYILGSGGWRGWLVLSSSTCVYRTLIIVCNVYNQYFYICMYNCVYRFTWIFLSLFRTGTCIDGNTNTSLFFWVWINILLWRMREMQDCEIQCFLTWCVVKVNAIMHIDTFLLITRTLMGGKCDLFKWKPIRIFHILSF